MTTWMCAVSPATSSATRICPGSQRPTGGRRSLKNVPIVVMTAVANPDRAADRCNADAVLAKPFDDAALRRLVRHVAR